MRQTQSNRRGRGRSRKAQNPLTKNYESNGPDVKIRGTAAHISEKYNSLARDAQTSGDIVRQENYFQHAEHYNRIIAAAQQNNQSNNEKSDDQSSDETEQTGSQDQDRQTSGRSRNDGGRSDGRKNNNRRRRPDNRSDSRQQKTSSETIVNDAGDTKENGDAKIDEVKPTELTSTEVKPTEVSASTDKSKDVPAEPKAIKPRSRAKRVAEVDVIAKEADSTAIEMESKADDAAA